MTNVHETLHPDSKTFERLATQKVVEKTDTQL
jgi:hypothetical protein